MADRETAELQREVAELKRALRWSLGFIVNVATGLELTTGARALVAQIRQGVKEGIKRSDVPRGILTDLVDAELLLKEWDQKTFRTEENAEVVSRRPEAIVLRHATCPQMLKTMRQYAPFLIRRVELEHYPVPGGESSYDFLCIPCTICRRSLVEWLSDGRFTVEEMWAATDEPWKGICGYRIIPA